MSSADALRYQATINITGFFDALVGKTDNHRKGKYNPQFIPRQFPNSEKNIAATIIQKQADYVLALKANHEKFFKEITAFFAQAESKNFRDHAIKYCETKDHGRFEIRRYWVTDQLATFEHTKPWKDLRLIGMVEAERTVRGKTTIERRYYISSLEKNVILFAKAVRYIGSAIDGPRRAARSHRGAAARVIRFPVLLDDPATLHDEQPIRPARGTRSCL